MKHDEVQGHYIHDLIIVEITIKFPYRNRTTIVIHCYAFPITMVLHVRLYFGLRVCTTNCKIGGND